MPNAAKEHRATAAGRATLALRELPIPTAWNLQGDPRDAAFLAHAAEWLGFPLPLAPNTGAGAGEWTALWVGPRSWLLLAATARSPQDYAARRGACNAADGALFDVTAGRVGFQITGARAAQFLSAFTPLDLHPRAFAVGSCAQSVFGHVTALIHAPAAETFNLLVARSLQRDTWHALCETGARYGAEVLPP